MKVGRIRLESWYTIEVSSEEEELGWNRMATVDYKERATVEISRFGELFIDGKQVPHVEKEVNPLIDFEANDGVDILMVPVRVAVFNTDRGLAIEMTNYKLLLKNNEFVVWINTRHEYPNNPFIETSYFGDSDVWKYYQLSKREEEIIYHAINGYRVYLGEETFELIKKDALKYLLYQGNKREEVDIAGVWLQDDDIVWAVSEERPKSVGHLLVLE